MTDQHDPVKDANRALDVLMAMAGDLPARLAALEPEHLEALHLAARIGAASLESKAGLRPAFDVAMFLWSIIGAEQTRRVHRDEAESRELERVFNLNAAEQV